MCSPLKYNWRYTHFWVHFNLSTLWSMHTEENTHFNVHFNYKHLEECMPQSMHTLKYAHFKVHTHFFFISQVSGSQFLQHIFWGVQHCLYKPKLTTNRVDASKCFHAEPTALNTIIFFRLWSKQCSSLQKMIISSRNFHCVGWFKNWKKITFIKVLLKNKWKNF